MRTFAGIIVAAAGIALAVARPAVGEPDYAATGRLIATALNERDAATLNALFETDGLVDRVMVGLRESEETAGLRRGMDVSLGQFADRLINSLGEAWSASFVRVRELDGERRALVRLDLGEAGLNYYDFVLAAYGADVVQFVDWYDYATGQTASESVRQALAIAMPQTDSMLERLLGVQRVDARVIDDFRDLLELANSGDAEGWLARYDTAHERLRQSRLMLLQRVFVAGATQQEGLYQQALGDVAEHFGDDPRLALVLLDHHIYAEDYAAAHTALGRMREYTGGDAAIDGMDANVYYLQQNYSQAARLARRAIEQDDGYVDAYWTLLDATVYGGHFDEAVATLVRLEHDFGYEFDIDALAATEGYGAFAASEQFAAWSRGRAVP